MKKIIGLILICLISVGLFSACDNIFGEVFNNMSDLRINYFEGENKNIYVNLSCGYREDVFAYDGISQKPVECGVIVLGFYNIQSYNSVVICLEVDGIITEYTLEKSPYENVYMEDIGKILNSSNKICLSLKNQNEKIELKDVSDSWNINYKNAIKIATEFFKKDLSGLYYNSKFNAECYLKVIAKPNFDNKYWYFSFIDTTDNLWSCLIDVFTGHVSSFNS